MKQSEQLTGLMSSIVIEKSPVESNTTRHHDRLANVLDRVISTDTGRYNEPTYKGDKLNA